MIYTIGHTCTYEVSYRIICTAAVYYTVYIWVTCEKERLKIDRKRPWWTIHSNHHSSVVDKTSSKSMAWQRWSSEEGIGAWLACFAGCRGRGGGGEGESSRASSWPVWLTCRDFGCVRQTARVSPIHKKKTTRILNGETEHQYS